MPGLLVVAIATLKLREGVPLHEDEPAWVGSAYYYQLLLDGQLRHPDWRLLPARESPPVGKYLFGAVLSLCARPIRTIEPLASHYELWRRVPGAWGTGQDANDRQAIADRISPVVRSAIWSDTYRPIGMEQLWATRLLVVAFGILGAIAICSVGTACRGPTTGLLAGLLFAMHPIAIEAYTHALFDMIALAFSVLAVRSFIALLGPMWGKPHGRCHTLATGVVAGVLLALAVGTKMNALVVAVLAFVLCLVLVGRSWLVPTRAAATLVLVLLLAMSVALVIFIAVNPTLYPDVLGGLRDSMTVPARTTKVQASFLPNYLATPSAKWAALGTLVCGHPAGLFVLAALFAVPTWFEVRRLTPRTVIVLWWWLALVMVAMWIPFPWSRYALPVLPPAAILTANALTELAVCGRGWNRD